MTIARPHHFPIRPLAIIVARAFVVFVLVLLIVAAISRGAFANPVGVVLVMAALGPIDVRRRRETALWGNLGYGAWVFPVTYGGVALASELLIVWMKAART